MQSHLASHFKAVRLERGLTAEQLARRIGAENVRKAMSRIGRFEAGGKVSDDLLALLADALDIDLPTVEALVEQDRRAAE